MEGEADEREIDPMLADKPKVVSIFVVKNIAMNKARLVSMPQLKIFLRPYISLSLGSQGKVITQPKKTIEPIMAIFHFGQQTRSSFSTQLWME